jgi:2-polyprenyl-3-methyl-5-hydroxy-6-metoxy-1,4-benzoquinol methylase
MKSNEFIFRLTGDKDNLLKQLSPSTTLIAAYSSAYDIQIEQLLPSTKVFKDENALDLFDLVYIGARTYYDGIGDDLFSKLESMLSKGLYLFVDKNLLIDDVNLSVLYFLKKYRDHISCSFNLHDGEVIIITKQSAQIRQSITVNGYEAIQSSYNAAYYLCDCGGYDTFKEHGGAQLDSRLMSVYLLSDVHTGERVLDVGCGRGELSHFIYAHSRAGVVGLDYSQDAVSIAKETFAEAIGDNLEYVQADILNYSPPTKFNKVILSDVIEHIEQVSLEKIFEKISSNLLFDDGVMIGHTAPNLHYYSYFYESRRREAKRLGLFMPQNPRSVYEDMMHINEQTEQGLQLTLEKFFTYVYVWIPLPDDFFGTLRNPYAFLESTNTNDIYCIASNAPIDLDKLYTTFSQNRINELKSGDIILTSRTSSLTALCGQVIYLSLNVANHSPMVIKSFAPCPVNVCYHIYDPDGSAVTFDGLRTPLPGGLLQSGSETTVKCGIQVPDVSGEYIVKMTMVQETCFWFEEYTEDILFEVKLVVE